MRILGIDPGTATTGYGFIDSSNGENKVIEWGLIETDKNSSVENRLEKIYQETSELLKKLIPDVFVFEKIFFATNAKTVIAVGQAQGVMLLAASKAKIKIESYTYYPNSKQNQICRNTDRFMHIFTYTSHLPYFLPIFLYYNRHSSY